LLDFAHRVAVSVSLRGAADSSTGLPHRVRKRKIPKVERRALNDRPAVVDHQAKKPMLGEECQAMPAAVRIDASLGKACDFPACICFRNRGLVMPRPSATTVPSI
jgi:hypothetical protein